MLSSKNSQVSFSFSVIIFISLVLSACASTKAETPSISAPEATTIPNTPTSEGVMDIMKKPLITNMYTADPSAHVFEGKLYIYPSHDLDHNNADTGTNEGDQFDMEDYHVFSMEDMQSLPVDEGEVLNVKDVPWAEKQMWAPDAAFKDGTYYLYFPARDKDHIFRIGVATSKSPAGPFTAEPDYIQGSFGIDPCVFVDDDGQAYMIFGGLWGGQLEKWKTGQFDPDGKEPRSSEPALGPRIAKLSADMLSFDGPVGEISILDKYNAPLLAGESDKHFFEAAWMHKYNGVYYLSYSTGTTHYLAYATGDNPMGPFTFRGYILNPVLGWTTHHSIVEFQGKWYLFYHDATLSKGVDYKRNIKVTELTYNADGSIETIDPQSIRDMNMKKLSMQVWVGLAGILFLLDCTRQSQIPIPVTSTTRPITNTSTAIPTATQTTTPTLTPPPTITFTPTYAINPDGLFLSDMRPYINPENVLVGLALDRVFWQSKIVINGKYYEKGLGMHPPDVGIAFVGYRVPKGYTQFLALAGLAWQDGNPGCKTVGDAKFRVFVDNELKFDSGVVYFGPPLPVEIAVKEGDVIRLEVDNAGDGYECDHATWADARFEP